MSHSGHGTLSIMHLHIKTFHIHFTYKISLHTVINQFLAQSKKQKKIFVL
jgi:hypothetical protein